MIVPEAGRPGLEIAMRTMGFTGAWLAVALTIGSNASAKIVDFTYHGTVSQLVGASGLFGAAVDGDPYTLVFRADTTRGAFISGGGGYTDGTRLLGGSDAGQNTGFPNIDFSPVSAVLVIDGIRVAFHGRNFGEADYVNSYFGTIVGRPDENSSSLYQSAVDESRSGSVHFRDFIEAGVGLFVVPFTDPVAPIALHIDGKIVQSSGDFTYLYQDSKSGRSINASGTLHAADLTVADVPEPGSPVVFTSLIGLAAASRARVCLSRDRIRAN